MPLRPRAPSNSFSPRSFDTATRTPDSALRTGPHLTPRTIPESTITALGELLVRMFHDEAQPNAEGIIRAGADVRDALRALCEDARVHRVRVEQLVIAIKQGWSSLLSESPRMRSAGPDALLNRVITLCIDEYYATSETR
jgi:hypothetical protein